MTQNDLTKRIEATLVDLGSIQARLNEIYTSLRRDYQACLEEIEKLNGSFHVSSPADAPPVQPEPTVNPYQLVSAPSWFSALEELRRQGSGKTIIIHSQDYVRPFTMKENLQARIEDFNTLTNPDGTERTEEERKRFFNIWLDSCSSIHYLARTTRFKINPVSPELITLAQAPTLDYLAAHYAQTQVTELDSTVRGVKYNCALSRAEVLEHPAWLAAVKEDRVLLGDAFDIVCAVKNAPANWNGMGFYVYPNKAQDELRPLFVDIHNYQGNANGRNSLTNYSRFLRQ